MRDLIRCDQCQEVSGVPMHMSGGMIAVEVPPFPLPRGGARLRDYERQFDFCSYECLKAWAEAKLAEAVTA